MTSTVSNPPIPRVPIIDANGNMTVEWQNFFRDLYARVGESTALTNTELESAIGAMAALSSDLLVATDADGDLESVASLDAWIAGTTDEITVGDNGDGTVTLSLPDSIKLDGATASRILATDADKKTVSISSLMAWVEGTDRQVIVADNGSGVVTFSLPQNIARDSSPEFAAVTLSDLTASRLVTANADKKLVSLASLVEHALILGSGTGEIIPLAVAGNGEIPIGSVGADPVLTTLTGTALQVIIANAAGSITLSLPQDIDTGASPEFDGVQVALEAKTGNYTLTLADTVILADPGTGAFSTAVAPTADEDDGRVNLQDNSFSTINNFDYLGVSGLNTFESFVRFDDFVGDALPQGSVITNAEITVEWTNPASVVEIIAYCEDADAAVAPTSWAEWLALSLTTGTTQTPLGVGATIDITSEVQEVVDRVGYTAGNAVMALLHYSAGGGYKYFNSFNSGTAIPSLTVEFNSSDQIITIPTAIITGNPGRSFVVVNVNNSYVLDIATEGAETINGSATVRLSNQYDAVILIPDGTNVSAFFFRATLPVAEGGTGLATITDHALVVGSGTDPLTVLAAATNGQLPIGSTGADPVLAALTGTANQITITNAAGSITLSLPQDLDIATDLLVNTLNGAYIQLVATGNISVGEATTMDSLTTGNLNVVVGGGGSGSALADANGNILIGYSCANKLLDKDNNIIIGRNAGYAQISPETCVMIGYAAGQSGEDTTRAVYVGYSAGGTIKGGEANVFIGYFCGTGHNPVAGTADGTTAGHLIDSTETFLTDGIVKSTMVIRNTTDDTETTITAVADGDLTLTADIFVSGENYNIITAEASYNVGVGRRVFNDISDGGHNVGVGNGAGIALRSGSDCVLIGDEAGELLTDEDNVIFIGNQAGAKHALSDRLIIDAYPRADQATEITNAILYGILSTVAANQILTVNAAVNLGVGANRVEIDNTGEVTLTGTARVTNHHTIELSSMKRCVGSPPGEGLKDGFPTLDFSHTVDEEVFFSFHTPSRYDYTTDMAIHLAFFVDTAPVAAAGVYFAIEWKVTAAGAAVDFTAGTATIGHLSAITTGTPANDAVLIEDIGITGGAGAIAADSLILCRLYRDISNAGDTFAGDVRLIETHVHYISDKLGVST